MIRATRLDRGWRVAWTKSDWIWIDGEMVPWGQAKIHVSTEAVLKGENVFEGVRAYWNPDHDELYIFRNDRHLRRLRESAKIMRMTISYSDETLTEIFINVLKKNDFRSTVHFRPVVYFGEGERGAWMPDKIRTGLFVMALDAPHDPAIFEGVKSCTSTWRRPSDLSSPPRVKSGANYHNSRLARVEAKLNGFDDPIMLNDRGKVAEGPGSCFFVIRNGRPMTPPVTADILESITRESLITLFRDELGMDVEEREIDRTEVYLAEEAFFCGSGAEVRPVVAVDHYALGDGKVGRLTKQIQTLFFDVAKGRVAKYRDWLTPVYDSEASTARTFSAARVVD